MPSLKLVMTQLDVAPKQKNGQKKIYVKTEKAYIKIWFSKEDCFVEIFSSFLHTQTHMQVRMKPSPFSCHAYKYNY